MSKTIRHLFLLAAACCLFFIVGNGLLPLSDPDEVFYSQTAKEMAARNEWNVPFLFGHPQFEKPVLIFWLLRAAFLMFGVTDFSARFFPALFALMGVFGVYLLAELGFRNSRKALTCSFVLMSGILYIGMARTVFTDMVFTVFILLAFLSFYWGYAIETRRGWGIILFFVFGGLATLTKGPLGLLLPSAAVLLFLAVRKETKKFLRPELFAGCAVFLALTLPWYWYMIRTYGSAFTGEFFYNDHIRRLFFAEHRSNDRWFFYPFSMLGLVFPWSFFLAAALYRYWRSRMHLLPLQHLLVCWLAVVFGIFQVAHSKLVSYILPLFPALALICGDFIAGFFPVEAKNRDTAKRLFLFSWLVFLLLPFGLAFLVSKLKLASPTPLTVGIFAVVLLVWLALLLSLIARKYLQQSFYLLALTLPVVFIFNPINLEEIEPYFSSEDICQRLQSQPPFTSPILVSKSFARGIVYYTGKPVVIFGVGQGNYFSPHPVAFLDSDEKVSGLLTRNGTTYCVLKKKQVSSVEAIAQHAGLKAQVLMASGNACLLKVGK